MSIYQQCVRSGFCCKKAPCAFGKWNHQKSQCDYLRVEKEISPGVEIHSCGIYNEIKDKPGADMNPAFGAGCCSSLFNENRNNIIRLMIRGENVQH
jgi:hypothetical protein